MPPGMIKDDNSLMRVFAYGNDKTQKTWWALKCAEAGFNTILLNGDDGAQIMRMIPEEARALIQHVNLVNQIDRAVFAEFMAVFLRTGASFFWDEGKKTFVSKPSETDGVYHVNSKLLTPNDVLILDSWTALCASVTFRLQLENRLDPTGSNMEKAAKEDKRALFGMSKLFLDHALTKLHTLPCHVIVIGHATVYEKRAADQKTIISQTTQPISSSGPHAMTIGAHFNDYLYFQRLSGDKVKIDPRGSQTRMGGSRNLAPQIHDWADCGPEVILKSIGAQSDGRPCEAFKWYAPGESLPAQTATTNKTIGPDAARASTVTVGVTTDAATAPKKNIFGKKTA